MRRDTNRKHSQNISPPATKIPNNNTPHATDKATADGGKRPLTSNPAGMALLVLSVVLLPSSVGEEVGEPRLDAGDVVRAEGVDEGEGVGAGVGSPS